MIQDIGNHNVEIVFDSKDILKKEDYVIGFEKESVFLKSLDDTLELLRCEDLLPVSYEEEAFDKYKKDAVFLMKIDGTSLYLLPSKYMTNDPGAVKSPISVCRKGNLGYISYTVISAYHMYHWYENTKFCGACGVRLRHGKEERSMICPICGNVIYPTIHPAIIVGVVHEDKILLTKYAGGSGQYALVAGYCEIGETLEETIHREVMEETGIYVKDIRYYKSQPWGFSQSLLSGFFAKLDGDDQIHIDINELSTARWIKREDLKGCRSETTISLTGEMIEYFRIHPELFD